MLFLLLLLLLLLLLPVILCHIDDRNRHTHFDNRPTYVTKVSLQQLVFLAVHAWVGFGEVTTDQGREQPAIRVLTMSAPRRTLGWGPSSAVVAGAAFSSSSAGAGAPSSGSAILASSSSSSAG